MRSAQIDRGSVITFDALFLHAASGSGVAQPGSIPFTFRNTAAGTYDITFDSRIRAITARAMGASGMAMAIVGSAIGSGLITLVGLGSGGGGINTHIHFSVTAIDKRN